MPYTLELPQEEEDCWLLHLDLLKSAANLCQTLLDEGHGYLKTAPPSGADYLRTLRDLDLQTKVWVEQVLAGYRANE